MEDVERGGGMLKNFRTSYAFRVVYTWLDLLYRITHAYRASHVMFGIIMLSFASYK